MLITFARDSNSFDGIKCNYRIEKEKRVNRKRANKSQTADIDL